MTTPKLKGSKYTVEISNLYAGGLITINLLFLQDFFSMGVLSLGALVAAIAFAVALPALTGILVVNTIQSWYPYRPHNSLGAKLLQGVFLIGIVASVIGIFGIFMTMSLLVASAFISAIIMTSCVVLLYVSNLSNKP